MAERVIVGLSGGVDSSVAALLLKEQGFDVECLFMKNWDDPGSEYCTAEEDYRDALRVSEALDLPLHTVNFEKEYRERVFEHFLNEYKSGRTPNPDIICNSEIKFRSFLDYALDLGADQIATGHYARIGRVNGSCRLLRGSDPDKDQSYFLYALNQEQLASSLFPIGNLLKNEVRKKARKHEFVTHDKKDSAGICFIGEQRHFKEFLKQYLPPEPGAIITVDGKECGRHEGLMYYTIGQRKGLGIGGGHGPGVEPWYVVDKALGQNELIVAQGHDHSALHSKKLIADDLKWISGTPPSLPIGLQAKIRYRQKDEDCTLAKISDRIAEVQFKRPLFAVTPGQSIVFYKGEECIGGGIIKERG